MTPPDSQKKIQKKVVVAACFGTFLEWYDFLTFASLAVYFSVLFFPADDPVAALLASLGTFGVGMIVRPLGAALFGSLGDRHGRRTIFLVTIVLMGVSTVLVGLLPTYEQVGLLAPALLLVLRMLQGLSVGGEIGGAAVYLTEHAPEGRRGLYTSVLQLMGPLGMMASTLQIIVLPASAERRRFQGLGLAHSLPAFRRAARHFDPQPDEPARIAGLQPVAREERTVQDAATRMLPRPPYAGAHGAALLLRFGRRLAAVLLRPGLYRRLSRKPWSSCRRPKRARWS